VLVRNLACGLVAVAAISMLVSQAAARQARRITLKIGDVVVVAGTDLACQTQIGQHVIKGQKLVTCFKVKGSGLAPNSYIVALGVNGQVAVAKIAANGVISSPVFDRKPAVLGTGSRVISAHDGDELLLVGTDLGCKINDDASGIYPACLLATATGGVPGSYAFTETARFAAVLRFDQSGKKPRLVFRRLHGH
jgi:hypothetical protein